MNLSSYFICFDHDMYSLSWAYTLNYTNGSKRYKYTSNHAFPHFNIILSRWQGGNGDDDYSHQNRRLKWVALPQRDMRLKLLSDAFPRVLVLPYEWELIRKNTKWILFLETFTVIYDDIYMGFICSLYLFIFMSYSFLKEDLIQKNFCFGLSGFSWLNWEEKNIGDVEAKKS